MLVRPYEYIIGRLNGEFSKSDPSLYRRKKNASDSIYQQQPTKSNDIKRSVYAQSGPAPLQQPPDKPVDDDRAPADNLEKMSEMMLKLPELKILVNKHLPPLEASQIIANANYLASRGTQGNSEFL